MKKKIDIKLFSVDYIVLHSPEDGSRRRQREPAAADNLLVHRTRALGQEPLPRRGVPEPPPSSPGPPGPVKGPGVPFDDNQS